MSGTQGIGNVCWSALSGQPLPTAFISIFFLWEG